MPQRLRASDPVHGDTVTSQVIFTEYRQDYATWVKLNGQWLHKTRQIASRSNPPDGWRE